MTFPDQHFRQTLQTDKENNINSQISKIIFAIFTPVLDQTSLDLLITLWNLRFQLKRKLGCTVKGMDRLKYFVTISCDIIDRSKLQKQSSKKVFTFNATQSIWDSLALRSEYDLLPICCWLGSFSSFKHTDKQTHKHTRAHKRTCMKSIIKTFLTSHFHNL